VTYLHGTRGDELLGYKTASWSSYHTDALGSVTRLTDSAGGTASTYRYDAFGGIRAQTGSGNTYGFTSRESETGAGLYYNRARYYEPSAGRFLGADPTGLRGGMNRYAYVGGNPVNRRDPSGLRLDFGYAGGLGGFGIAEGAVIVALALAALGLCWFSTTSSQPYTYQPPTSTGKLTREEFYKCQDTIAGRPFPARWVRGHDGNVYEVQFHDTGFEPGKRPHFKIFRQIWNGTRWGGEEVRTPPPDDQADWWEGEYDLPSWWNC